VLVLTIEKIEVYTVSLNYKEPFRMAIPASAKSHNLVVRMGKWLLYKMPLGYATGDKSHNVVLKIIDDQGMEGLGASSRARIRAPPRVVAGETVASIMRTLDKIGPKLIGLRPLDIERNVEFMDSIVGGNPAAKSAVDMGLHDIWGKTLDKPLHRLLGGYRTEVLTDKSLGLKPPKEMAQDALGAVKKGFKAIKAKVGANPIEDVERVKLIRRAVGDDIELRVDANQAWTSRQAIEVLGQMEKFDVQFAEQPVTAEDVQGMREIRRNTSIPIMADESVYSQQDALRLIQAEAIDMINIKLMKSGGILKAGKIAAIAEAARVPCMMGCGIESEIGIAAATHLAAATKNIQYADLESDLLLRDNLVTRGGTPVKNSLRILPEQAGLGIEQLNEKLLQKPARIYK